MQIPFSEANLGRIIISASVLVANFRPDSGNKEKLLPFLNERPEFAKFPLKFLEDETDFCINLKSRSCAPLLNRALMFSQLNRNSSYNETTFKILVAAVALLAGNEGIRDRVIRDIGRALGGWESAINSIIANEISHKVVVDKPLTKSSFLLFRILGC